MSGEPGRPGAQIHLRIGEEAAESQSNEGRALHVVCLQTFTAIVCQRTGMVAVLLPNVWWLTLTPFATGGGRVDEA